MVALSILHDGRTSRKSRRSLDQSISYKVVRKRVYSRRPEQQKNKMIGLGSSWLKFMASTCQVVSSQDGLLSSRNLHHRRLGMVWWHCSPATSSSNIVSPSRKSIGVLLFKRCLAAGLTKGGKTNSDVGGSEWWHCPFCEQDVRAAHLDDHLHKESHIKWYKYKWTLHYVAAAATHPDPLLNNMLPAKVFLYLLISCKTRKTFIN